MWMNEIDLGTTLYADAAKKWNVSTLMYHDIPSQKNNADIRVGHVLTLQGGAGRSFLKGAANAGVVYGAQWKVSHDSGAGIPPNLPITNSRVFGVGTGIQMQSSPKAAMSDPWDSCTSG
jgi:Putative MetA-pathway of phenol degradation